MNYNTKFGINIAIMTAKIYMSNPNSQYLNQNSMLKLGFNEKVVYLNNGFPLNLFFNSGCTTNLRNI